MTTEGLPGDTVPCPRCGGAGVLPAERCIGLQASGQPCRTLARYVTDPQYLDRHPWVVALPQFMLLCSRHGNILIRRLNDRQRAEERAARRLAEAEALGHQVQYDEG